MDSPSGVPVRGKFHENWRVQTAYRSSNTRRARPACKPSACDSCRAENGSCSPTEAAAARAWTPNTCSCYPLLPESTESASSSIGQFQFSVRYGVWALPDRSVRVSLALFQWRYINLGGIFRHVRHSPSCFLYYNIGRYQYWWSIRTACEYKTANFYIACNFEIRFLSIFEIKFLRWKFFETIFNRTFFAKLIIVTLISHYLMHIKENKKTYIIDKLFYYLLRPNHCHHVTDFDTLMNLIFFSKSYSSYISISQPGRSEKASDALLYIPFGVSRLSDSSCWHLYRSNNACASAAWNTVDPFSSSLPSLPDLDMSCHRMDIAFHGIRRGLRTNFTLHSTALDTFRQRLIERRRRREREKSREIYTCIQAHKRSQHGSVNRRRDEGFTAGVGRVTESERGLS